jgi:hypothetical protein
MQAGKDLVHDRECIDNLTMYGTANSRGLNQQLQSQADLRLAHRPIEIKRPRLSIHKRNRNLVSRDEVKSHHYIDTKKAACF